MRIKPGDGLEMLQKNRLWPTWMWEDEKVDGMDLEKTMYIKTYVLSEGDIVSVLEVKDGGSWALVLSHKHDELGCIMLGDEYVKRLARGTVSRRA